VNDLIEFAADPDPDDPSLASVSALARKMIAAEDLVSERESALAQAQKELATLRDELLPKAMATVDAVEFTLPGGFKVGVKETAVCGQLDDAPDPEGKKRPLEARLAGLRLLDDEGHGDLARRTVTVVMGAKSEELALELVELLRTHRLGNQLTIEQRRLVYWNTLASFAKERKAAGDEAIVEHFDDLGVVILQRAYVKRPKKTGNEL
jgi:hypothetical protein